MSNENHPVDRKQQKHVEVHAGFGLVSFLKNPQERTEEVPSGLVPFAGGLGSERPPLGQVGPNTYTVYKTGKSYKGVEANIAVSFPALSWMGLKPEIMAKLSYAQGRQTDVGIGILERVDYVEEQRVGSRIDGLLGGGLNWSYSDDEGTFGLRANILGAFLLDERGGGTALYAGGGLFLGGHKFILAADFHAPVSGDSVDLRETLSLQRRF